MKKILINNFLLSQMLFFRLLSHHFKSFFRNAIWRHNVLGKIGVLFLVLYLTLVFITLGYNIEKILLKVEGDPVEIFNGFLLWYFAGDLCIRTFFLSTPAIQVLPYTRFNINKRSIINYLLTRNLWNIFNLLPWFIIVPYSHKFLTHSVSGMHVFYFYLGIAFILLINNYLSFLIKYMSQKKFLILFSPLVFIGILFLCDYFGFSVIRISVWLGFLFISGNIYYFVFAFASIVLLFVLNHKLFLDGFYIDEIKSLNKLENHYNFQKLKLSERFGLVGDYLSLEFCLLFRNKRTKMILYIIPFWVVYIFGVVFNDKNFGNNIQSFFMFSIFIGIGALSYGQYIFSWDSSYMDGLMSRKSHFEKYLLAKYVMMNVLTLLVFIPVFIGSFFYAKSNPWMIISCFLYFSGGILFIIFYMATYNDKRIDLSQSQFFNYQGVNSQHFLSIIIIFLAPTLFFWGLKAIFNVNIALVVIALIGILFILCSKVLINKFIAPRFINRKYKNLEGYRKLTN